MIPLWYSLSEEKSGDSSLDSCELETILLKSLISHSSDELRRNNKAPVMEAYEKAVDSGLQMLAYTIPPFVLSTLQQRFVSTMILLHESECFRQQDQVTLAYDDDLDVQLNLAEMDEELEK